MVSLNEKKATKYLLTAKQTAREGPSQQAVRNSWIHYLFGWHRATN